MTAFVAAPNSSSAAECTQPGAYPLAMAAFNAGVPIPADAEVTCVECAIPRWLDPATVWRCGWSGEPLCAHCATVLELAGELRGIDLLRAGS